MAAIPPNYVSRGIPDFVLPSELASSIVTGTIAIGANGFLYMETDDTTYSQVNFERDALGVNYVNLGVQPVITNLVATKDLAVTNDLLKFDNLAVGSLKVAGNVDLSTENVAIITASGNELLFDRTNTYIANIDSGMFSTITTSSITADMAYISSLEVSSIIGAPTYVLPSNINLNTLDAVNVSTSFLSTNKIIGGNQLQVQPVGSFDYQVNIESEQGNTYYEATWLDSGVLQIPHKMRMVSQPEYPGFSGAQGRVGYFVGGTPAGETKYFSSFTQFDVLGQPCMTLSNSSVNATTVNSTSNNANYISTNSAMVNNLGVIEQMLFFNTSSIVPGGWIREDQFGNIRLSTVTYTDIWTETRSLRLMGATLDGDMSLGRFSTIQCPNISTTTHALSVYSDQVQPVLPAGAQTPLTYTGDSFKEGLITWAGMGGSTITVLQSGNYAINTSIQFDTSTGGTNTVQFWFVKNGTAIPNSASIVSVTSQGETLGTVEILDTAVAGDQYAIYMASGDANMEAHAIPAASLVPGNPSIITNVKKI